MPTEVIIKELPQAAFNWIALFSMIATFSAVVVALFVSFLPGCRARRQRAERARIQREQCRTYLKILDYKAKETEKKIEKLPRGVAVSIGERIKDPIFPENSADEFQRIAEIYRYSTELDPEELSLLSDIVYRSSRERLIRIEPEYARAIHGIIKNLLRLIEVNLK